MRALHIVASVFFCVGAMVASSGALSADAPPLAAASPAADAKRPLLFFYAEDSKIDLGGAHAEIDLGKALDTARDRLVAGLGKTFGTTVLFQTFRHVPPSGSDVAEACARTGAVGAIDAVFAAGAGVNDTYRGAFTLSVLDCSGSEFFSETGASVHGPGKAEFSDVILPAMEDAYAHIDKDVADSPKASANYERYGMYMADRETDSFWLPTIEGKKTIVDVCEPVGTASRAGLRVGDEVRSIDGVPTVGIDFDALNAAMKQGVATGMWTLEIVGRDKTPHTLTFQNQTTAWYAAHPLAPSAIPTRAPLPTEEKKIPFSYSRG